MHPAIIFIPCNEELVMLKDLKYDFEIVGKKLSTNTNFDGQICRNEDELSAFVETDMRSMYNPKRREVIAEATENMLIKALTNCEKCTMPGFGVTDIIRGLPCELCGEPTQSAKSFVHSCKKCDFTEIQSDPKKLFESPQYCDYCNP